MTRLATITTLLWASAAAWIAVVPTFAQSAEDTADGAQIYAARCALCHKDDGAGDPPRFPALAGNDRLAEASHVTAVILEGPGAMPPFADLTPAELAAVATHVRTSWGNAFGDVTTDQTAALDEMNTGGATSVWDGVYSAEQAARGRAVYDGACGLCHGRRLNGAPEDPDMPSSPPLARARFLRTWDGRSLATLFEFMRATMPEDNPASLDDQEYVDVIAHMLSVGGMPAGGTELTTDRDALAGIRVEPQP